MTTVYLLVAGEARRRIEAHPSYGDVDGSCPRCGNDELRVQGAGKRPSADDRAWEADGFAMCCGKHVGTIRAEVDTIFGVREDQAVLHGRARVY